MTTIRLTAAQALVRYLAAQREGDGDGPFHGIWAIKSPVVRRRCRDRFAYWAEVDGAPDHPIRRVA